MRFREDTYYIERTLEGDMSAFGQLIQKHERYAYTLAMQILKNAEEAEEAAQDAFMKVYHSLGNFEGKSKFTTWLYRIVYHEALARLRKHNKQFVSIEELVENEDSPLDFMDGLKAIESQERSKLIQQGLQRLKPSESSVLTLHYLEEQSIKEICLITDLSESHVKILLHRGRKHLLEAIRKITNQELIHLL